LTVFEVKDQDTLMMSLYQFTLLELVRDYDVQITVTWSSRVHVLCVSFSADSTYLHMHLCGTTFRLN